jgi:hypothetical protein
MEFLEKTPYTLFAVGKKFIICAEGNLIITRLGHFTKVQYTKIIGEEFEYAVTDTIIDFSSRQME